jgi:wobble nucleotide-excising tRNase
MTEIARIRTLKGMGVLADKAAKDTGPNFLRYNLIYGFNGSGKSTLSRVFSCLQLGKIQVGLPEGSSFSMELSDGTTLNSPDKLGGLEHRICVFNTDFTERHLRWAEGKASSIFYISEKQAEAAAALKAAEATLPTLAATLGAADEKLTDKTQIFANLKKSQAKAIAAKLHLTSRKYEAPNLHADYGSLKFDDSRDHSTSERTSC